MGRGFTGTRELNYQVPINAMHSRLNAVSEEKWKAL